MRNSSHELDSWDINILLTVKNHDPQKKQMDIKSLIRDNETFEEFSYLSRTGLTFHLIALRPESLYQAKENIAPTRLKLSGKLATWR